MVASGLTGQTALTVLLSTLDWQDPLVFVFSKQQSKCLGSKILVTNFVHYFIIFFIGIVRIFCNQLAFRWTRWIRCKDQNFRALLPAATSPLVTSFSPKFTVTISI